MRKTITLFAFLFLLFVSTNSTAQITGDTAVCAGNFYTYTSNILNADSFHWTTPVGWYHMQGQSTSQITVNCNVNAGDVCVEGYDSAGVSVGVQCLTTSFGGGGAGWDVQPSSFTYCEWQPGINPSVQSFQLVPNGITGNCGPCSGFSNPHLIYGVYDGNGIFKGVPNGSSIFLPYSGSITWQVFQVDTIAGKNLPQAVIIYSCGGAVNNTINANSINGWIPLDFNPDYLCVGASVYVMDNYGISMISASAIYGCSPVGYNLLQIDSTTFEIFVTGYDGNSCYSEQWIQLNADTCTFDLTGDSIVCPGKEYDYNATMSIGYGYHGYWTFPNGWYDFNVPYYNPSVVCNVNDGDVCIDLYDGNNFHFDSKCISTQFGDGASEGWSVQPNSIHRCDSSTAPFTAQVIPNSTGGGGNCPIGCSSGVQHPNIVYAVYDSIWPKGNFVGVADGVSAIPFFAGNQPYYIYEVDTTNGVNAPNAILISGGCNVGIKNNIITHDTVAPLPTVLFNPTSVCLDSLISITILDNLINLQWTVNGGTIVSNNGNNIVVQPTSMNCSVSVSGIDSGSTCALSGTFNVPVDYCDSVSLLGDQTICAGYAYTYSVNMPHAANFNWTLPSGWYDITGQGTSQITATANSNAGLISVIGWDAGGYVLDSVSINSSYKLCRSKSVAPSIIKSCKTDSIKAKVKIGALGSGNCGFSCGNGLQHANIAYAVYDDVWPNGTFRGFADSIQNISPVTSTGNLYVYEIDCTNGTDATNAILISGGCGTCTFNNVILIDTSSLTTTISKTPAIACVGDTITLTENSNALNPYWDNAIDLNLLSQNVNPVTAIITGTNPFVDFTGLDSLTGCLVQKTKSINLPQQCFYPVASFNSNKTAFCEKQFVDFYDMTSNSPTSWYWTFYWGTPSTSTQQNPDSIFYNQYGSFNVKLIACNGLNCDTLMLANYITVYPSPPIPVITGSSGVMYSSPATGYAWYSTSNPGTVLSTDSFYIPTQLGDYFVIITDSNGCNSASTIFSITGLQQTVFENESTLTETSQNVFELILKNNFNDASIMITDAQGKIMLNKKAETINRFDFNSFSKGVYLLTLKTGNKISTRKLMVM